MGDAELPAVSILVGGAALAGFFPAAEYKLKKNTAEGQRLGRADLWFDTSEGDRSFEFKFWRNQHWGLEDLKTTMKFAISCASQIPRNEAKRIFAGTIARIHHDGAEDACIKLAEGMDFCYQFSAEGYKLYLIFKDVTRQTQ
ncbi:hypothetical protein ELI_04915 [Erythrobacter litoralis HTCC2594]|uniref:Uncharacterized protein n=2 Tax=Erythrobacter litoralis TaxID=39960 RepID=Q2NB66_ERYLH|nr:hypothetical protein ELI_04915 [Erythrobacter litoralis HTCC2594]